MHSCPQIKDLVQRLAASRIAHAEKGYKVDDTSIGVNPFGEHNPSVKLVDRDGGYWWAWCRKSGKFTRVCVGAPNRATESIANEAGPC